MYICYCEGIELEAMRQRWFVCLVLSVKLSISFYVSRLECVKSMLPTSSDQKSFCFHQDQTARQKQLNKLLYPAELVDKPSRGVCTPHPNTVYSYFCDRVELTILLLQRWYYKSPGMPHR